MIKKLIKKAVLSLIPNRYIIRKGKNKLYLTFDDGPNPVYTPKILDILKERNIKATFFLIGEEAEKYPDIVKRIHQEGHSIGNHTHTHSNLSKLSKKEIRNEIIKCSEAIRNITGERPSLLRPPFLKLSLISWFLNKTPKVRLVLNSLDSLDYKKENENIIISRVNPNKVRNGDIILFHDNNKYSQFKGTQESTINALPTILTRLQRKKFRFGKL